MSPLEMKIYSSVLTKSGARFSKPDERGGVILTFPDKFTKLRFLDEFKLYVKAYMEDLSLEIDPADDFSADFGATEFIYITVEFASILLENPNADFTYVDKLNEMMKAEDSFATSFFKAARSTYKELAEKTKEVKEHIEEAVNLLL